MNEMVPVFILCIIVPGVVCRAVDMNLVFDHDPIALPSHVLWLNVGRSHRHLHLPIHHSPSRLIESMIIVGSEGVHGVGVKVFGYSFRTTSNGRDVASAL